MNDIFYVEDDLDIARNVKKYLEQQHYRVYLYATIGEAKAALQEQLPELILIDWNMPDGEGNDFCSWIRSRWSELPVIIITVRSDTADIVSGFQNGADDYVTKPFELAVLHSRIAAMLRRTGKVTEKYLSCGEISLDQVRMMVFCREEEINLSQAEYSLLLLMMQNKGKTVTRERLLETIWDNNGNFVNNNTLTVTMKRLREKLHQPACLKTIRSFGYRMED